MSQAISEHTRGKQALVSSVMHAILTWFKECKKGARFTYFDMNAFKGIYSDEQGELKGSPVNFVEIAQAIDIPTLSVLFEQHSGYVKALYQNMSQLWSRKHVVIPIHAACETLIATALRYAIGTYGLIYADPCGSGVPFDVLAEIAVANVDLLIHLDGRVFLRQTGQRQTSSFSQQFAQLRALKKDWYIAPPVKTSTQSWAMLFGSSGSRHLVLHNLEERLGFKPLDSEEGQQFYNYAFAGGTGGHVGVPARSGVRSIPPRAKVTKVPAGVIKLVNGLAPKTRKAISVALRSDMSQPKIAEKHDVSIAIVAGVNKIDGVRGWGVRTGLSPSKRSAARTAAEQAQDCVEAMPEELRAFITEKLKAGLPYKEIIKAAKLSTTWKVRCVSRTLGGRYNTGAKPLPRLNIGDNAHEKQSSSEQFPDFSGRQTVAEATHRRELVIKLYSQGMLAPEIITRLQISRATVGRDLVGVASKEFVRVARSSAAAKVIAKNDADIQEGLRAEGTTATAKKFKINRGTLQRHYVVLLAELAQQRAQHIADRDEQMRKLQKDGLSHRAIGKELGVSSSLVGLQLGPA